MKNTLIILLILFISSTYGQEKIEMISQFDYPDFKSKEFAYDIFQGIEKLDISFTNPEKLIGKNYKLVIRKYKKGKIEVEKVVSDTKAEKAPKIGKDFKFSIIAQQLLNNEKIMLFYSDHFNKSIFEVNKKFLDGTFLLRDITENKRGKKVFEIGEEIQIALITPPNNDETKGVLGYCEVTKGEINVEEWYKQYQLSEFFLLYLTIEE